jgi:hypothetical protein
MPLIVLINRAQSAMGVLNAEDPFAKLRKEIMWDVVIDSTVSSHLFRKVRIHDTTE